MYPIIGQHHRMIMYRPILSTTIRLLSMENNKQQQRKGLFVRYEQMLETKFPRVYKLHRLVVDGKINYPE
jgi:hypothetical protein